ncbi:MAG: Colicin production protein [Devosia sp.]|uniref:CvpA family protein n=1 Tax=Devosia sp. TaxID=1871048 RepID=UPI002605F724|nr:CvpA family protein [Devosia sp.]MDB5542270.1 Colicin production protein [Devosia sp.]
MLTAFDVGIGVLVLISAILATARGFTREVLSLATWAGSAAIAAYAYFNHKDIARGYIAEPIVADIVTVLGTFIIALIILHLITMRIADFVVDSRIGPLDRSLGFIFGVARGVLIAVIVVIFGLWLMPSNLPSWAAESRSLPILKGFGDSLIGLLPPDLEKQVTDILQRGAGGAGEDESPAESPTTPDATPPDESTDVPEDATPQDTAPATNT